MPYHVDTGIRDVKARTHVFVTLPGFPADSERVQIDRFRFNSDEAVETLTLKLGDISNLIRTLRKVERMTNRRVRGSGKSVNQLNQGLTSCQRKR